MSITRWFDQVRGLRRPEHRMAWSIALVADALQIGLFPFFVQGGISPLDAGLDLIVGALLTKVMGWHWAFLPSFVAELVPGLDLFPTWTAAVFFVTRMDSRPSGEPEILPPSPTR